MSLACQLDIPAMDRYLSFWNLMAYDVRAYLQPSLFVLHAALADERTPSPVRRQLEQRNRSSGSAVRPSR